MAADSLTGEHLDTLVEVLASVPAGPVRRRLQDVLVWATMQYTAERVQQVTQELAAARQAPLVAPDLAVVEMLMRKGVQHNGVVPELKAEEVARGVSIVTELLCRAQAGALTQEDQEVLTWVFDAAAQDPDRRPFVRAVERKARRGLGVEERPVFTPHSSAWLA